MELLRKPVSGIMLTLLLIGMLALSFNIQLVKASGTVYIRADGSVDPPTAPISTVDNITYTFTGNIYDSIVVERDNIVVDGAGYMLQYSVAWSRGIDLSHRSNVTIKSIIIKDSFYGIYLERSLGNSIVGNSIANNSRHSIWLEYSSNNSISENNITNNYYGIWLSKSSNYNSISGNSITVNYGDNGISLYSSSNYNSISGNNITNSGNYGIDLSGGSSNNSITGNNITNNGANGIYLYSSSDNTISNNTLMSNRWVGFSVHGASIIQQASNNTFMNNTVTGSDCGFQFWGNGQYYNAVENNVIYSNGAGIQLGENARYNTFRGNTMSNNYYGLMIINGSEGSKNYGNNIFHNNFIDNAHQAVDNATGNVWNDGYPSGGNYWSNYTGVDLHSGSDQDETGSDGIGDTPHIIDANNTDRYPLIGPFNVFDAGIWDGTAYNVDVVSNSSVSEFQFDPSEGALLRFNVTGEEGTEGFCRVTIPKDLLWVEDGWTIFVGGEPITDYTVIPDENFTYLYFTYNHSTKAVVIQGTHVIPEFPSTMILLVLMLTTLIAITLLKKKRKTKPQLP